MSIFLLNILLCANSMRFRCEMADGSGEINLQSLSNPSGEAPKWNVSDNSGEWNYYYNPCIGFSGLAYFSDLAVTINATYHHFVPIKNTIYLYYP